MKNYYFLLFILGFGQLYGQAILEQTIPATLGANSTLRAPNGTTAHTTIRAHYMIYPNELTTLPMGAQITSVGFIYINGVNTAASGNLKFYLENSTATSNTKSTIWSTAIAGMDTLYDGAYDIPISTLDTTSKIMLSDTFTYTGNGIQVAYDYLGNAFATTSATYDCNNSVVSDLKLVTSSTTTPGTILSSSSSWRPGIQIGYINPFTNDMAVEYVILEAGHLNQVYDTTQTVIGTVRNKSQGTLTSIPITLEITGANPSTSVQTISSLAAGASQTLTFTGLSAASAGKQSIKLIAPSDQFAANDSVMIIQSINCDSISYADNSVPISAIGFNTASGILAEKHTASTSVNTSVKIIYASIDANTNITGNQVQAVLLDTGGVIIDSSAVITITSAHLGTQLSMPLTGNNLISSSNPDYYIGVRQYANAIVGYFPLATLAPTEVPTDRYFSFGISGGAVSAPYTDLGTLGIGAIVEVERMSLSNSDINDSICLGESVTFTVTGTSPSYEFKSGTTSLQNSASTTYTTSPTVTTAITVEGNYITCPIFSNPSTVTVTNVTASATKTNDTSAIASPTWASYQWIDCGTGLAVPGATSQTYNASLSGNYKVAVTIAGCSDTSSCLHLIVPYAGINENKIKSLKVYPSPTNSLLTIETDHILITSIEVMEISGKILSSVTPKNSFTKLDVSHLPSGVYLLNVITEKGSEIKRFIKQ